MYLPLHCVFARAQLYEHVLRRYEGECWWFVVNATKRLLCGGGDLTA